MRTIQVGDFLGNRRFEIIGRIGAGGMGAVFVAYDCELQTKVALKMLKEREAGAILLFKKEFRAIQDLQHPNLIRLGELFEQDRMWFFTMELLIGCDFLAYVRSSADRKEKAPTGGTDSGARTDRDPSQREHHKAGETAAASAPTPGEGGRPTTAPATVPMPTAGVTIPVPEDDPLTEEDDHFQTADLPTDDPPRPETGGQTAKPLDPAESEAALPPALPPSPVLSAAAFDEARLRAALGQLGRALCVLHEARKVHRDIKPSNQDLDGSGTPNAPRRREVLAAQPLGGGSIRGARAAPPVRTLTLLWA